MQTLLKRWTHALLEWLGLTSATGDALDRWAAFVLVVLAAVVLALLPPLFTSIQWVDSIQRALNFLVVSCPCALVISVPLSFFGGIGGASKNGILVKGGNYLEVLAKTELVVFDKTGTLTRGVFNVTAIHPDHCGEAQLLELAALAERYSDHPISRSLKEAYGKELDASRVSNVEELSGRGVRATVDGRQICAGNDKLMDRLGVPYIPCHSVGTIIHMAVGGKYAGHIVISDVVKPHAREAVQALRAAGVHRTVMLTGDAKPVADQVAQSLGIDQVYAELLPAGKVEKVEELLLDNSERGKLAFVGDGINDAPALKRAHVGIAMGGVGSDIAVDAADIALVNDDIRELPHLLALSKRMMRTIKSNLAFSMTLNFIAIALAITGILNPVVGALVHNAGSVLVIVNSSLLLKWRKRP